MKLKKLYSFNHFVALSLLIAILQALLGNLTHLNTSLVTPAFLALLFLGTADRTLSKIHPENILYLFLFFIFIYSSILSTKTFFQELLYQISFLCTFIILYFLSSTVTINKDSRFLNLSFLAFFTTSLVIHIFFWQEVANLFYQKDNAYGGLLMDGMIPRMYSLLLNPLTLGFSSLYLLATFFLLDIRNSRIKIILTLLIILSFSRTAIFCCIILWLLNLFHKKKHGYLVALFLLAVLSYFFSPLQEVVNATFTGADKTGSSSEHFRNLSIGSEYILDFYDTNGYVDARTHGGWNFRLESTFFQFAFTGGFYSFIFCTSLIIISYYRILSRLGFTRSLYLLGTLPTLIFFPIHTFNYAVFTLMLMLNCWRIKESCSPEPQSYD